MDANFIQNINFRYLATNDNFSLTEPLKESIQIIRNFWNQNNNHKLCLVFPTKEYAAQWLSIPTVLYMIQSDFIQFQNTITESLQQYKKGDLILLNNEAVVEWIGRSSAGFTFKHKEYKGEDKIIIDIKKISKIQPAPLNRRALSSYKRVRETLNRRNVNPIDKILSIQTDGNRVFQKNSVCLISKQISYENAVSEIKMNEFTIDEYFKKGKIDDTGEIDLKSPLLISNNFRNLSLYLNLSNTISSIIIDGFSAIRDRSHDFNDIELKRIPTILITDFSEVDQFDSIGNYGFDFYNFTRENLKLNKTNKLSPFNLFENKLHKFASFNLVKELCTSPDIEAISRLIYSIENIETLRELVNIKSSLILLTNIISRIAHPLSSNEVTVYSDKLRKIEISFFENKFFLGNSATTIETCITLLKNLIERLSKEESEKCTRLKELILTNKYEYIICANDDEAFALSQYLQSLNSNCPKVIPIAFLNNNLLQKESTKAILIGWVKSNNVNRLFSSFLFSNLTVLFYRFENRYFNSLQNRNKKNCEQVRSTIDQNGKRTVAQVSQSHAFSHIFGSESQNDNDTDITFDIAEFESNLENAQYSRFIVKENTNECIKAKRLEFEGNKFMYLTETHSLLVLENIDYTSEKGIKISKSRIENLKMGDVIAFLKTEREVLNRIVENQTTQEAFAETIRWINLWKSSLKEYYLRLNKDFNHLVQELRDNHCSREAATIRSWLFDDLKIGPRRDDDIISIALVSNKNELLENINVVRAAIRQMTSWRMQASDFVIEQIKNKLKHSRTKLKINNVIDFEDLGEVEILEISAINSVYDNVDFRNSNRLIEKIIFND